MPGTKKGIKQAKHEDTKEIISPPKFNRPLYFLFNRMLLKHMRIRSEGLCWLNG
jgi:hypothetical protein